MTVTHTNLLVKAATVTELPITPKSTPTILEPYHVDLLPAYAYTTREYLISGTAAGEEYSTRILLRCPSDPSKFSRVVIQEVSHIWSGTSVWRAINRWIMKNGHAWLQVDSQAPVAKGVVKTSNPTRYADLHFPPGPISQEFKDTIPFTPNPTRLTLQNEYSAFMEKWWRSTPQSPEILVAASHALRSGELGLQAQRVFLVGLSQTGGVTRRFLTHSSHLRLPNGDVPFDALVPAASGGPALPEPPAGVKVIEILGEAEFQSVRWACGVSGQTRGLSHRRPDSDAFRLYEVAGMAHRESRYQSLLDIERLKDCDLKGAKWSTFPGSFVYSAIYEALVEWTGPKGTPPPLGRILETIGDSDEILRDEHGNALGGVRSVYLDVPVSQFVAATPMGRPSWYCGSEWEFTSQKLKALYGTVDNYRKIAGIVIERDLESGFLLQCDAEILRRETVEKVEF